MVTAVCHNSACRGAHHTADLAATAKIRGSGGAGVDVRRSCDTQIEREARPRPVDAELAALWDIAATVVDPELPVLTIEDLGMLRGVRREGETVVVQLTPTYSGCPAVDALRADITAALGADGHDARVEIVLSPAWTTDWMGEAGRRKLEEYGIAPPKTHDGRTAMGLGIRCPQCGSLHTRELSRFGSTSCKALWECRSCGEPFDRFKEL